MAETVLAKLAVEITAKTTQFGKALSAQEKALKGFSNSVNNVSSQLKGAAALFGVALGATAISNFTFEVAKLAGEAEGVKTAFDRLEGSKQLMNDITQATGGTVSQLQLMKRAVQASNFQIDLGQLPELLKFATLRAQQTGQSVDYLVDSIVTGIGRKSPLILDNLGISAIRLREKFKGIGVESASVADVTKAVGEIAREELKTMGDFAENTSSKVQRLSATWDNFKVTLGNLVNQSGIPQDSLSFLTDILGGNSDPFASLQVGLGILNDSGIKGKEYAEALNVVEKNAELAGVKLIKLTDAATGLSRVVIDPRSKIQVIDESSAESQITTLASLQAKVKELNDQFTNETDIADKSKLASIGREITATQLQISTLEKLRQKQEEVNNQSLSSFGQAQLKQAESGELDPFGGIKKVGLPDEIDRLAEAPNPFLTQIPVPDIGPAMEALATYTQAQIDAGVAGVQSFDQMRLAGELQQEQQERQTSAALQFGQIIGQAIGSAAEGQKSFVQTMKTLTKQLLGLFLQQALGAAISGSFKTAKNPIIGAVLAGAATGVVSAMFASIGGPSKSVSGSVSRPSEGSGGRGFREQISNDQVILLGGEFKIRQNDLVLSLDKATKERQRTANG